MTSNYTTFPDTTDDAILVEDATLPMPVAHSNSMNPTGNSDNAQRNDAREMTTAEMTTAEMTTRAGTPSSRATPGKMASSSSPYRARACTAGRRVRPGVRGARM